MIDLFDGKFHSIIYSWINGIGELYIDGISIPPSNVALQQQAKYSLKDFKEIAYGFDIDVNLMNKGTAMYIWRRDPKGICQVRLYNVHMPSDESLKLYVALDEGKEVVKP